MARRGGAGGGLTLGAAALIAVLLMANGKMDGFLDWASDLNHRNSSAPAATAPAAVPDPGQPAPAALAQLNSLAVIASRPNPDGYERGCGTTPKVQKCSFGPAWTDDTTAPGGHNGCDTRNDVLKASMTEVVLKDGSDCVVIGGVYADPYTGKTMTFEKANASLLQVDHVVPLSLAWDLGASGWSQEQRNAFANDQGGDGQAAVLMLADGKSNSAKGDKGPADWMPSNKAFACDYDARFVAVLAKYGLPVTQADKDAMAAVLAGC